MALKLNATKEAYREFYGRNFEQMPKLIADGRFPMNVAQLMQRRLHVRNSDNAVKSSYMDNYFDTGDTIVYHPDGRVKIVLDSQKLRDMNSETQINGGALVLTGEVYDTLQGEEFKKGKLGKVNDSLSRKDVKAHPVWKVLARDQALLNDYADFIFAEGKERFSYDTAMGIYPSSAGGIYPSSAGGYTPEMRAWYVGGLGDRSYALGGSGLGNFGGRLVGITQWVVTGIFL